MTTQEHTGPGMLPHRRNGSFESRLIPLRTTTLWWSEGPRLTKWKIAAEDRKARGAKGTGQGHEKRRIAVGPSAVRQEKAIAAGISRAVQEPSNGDFIRIIPELSIVVHIQRQW
jgi:hypothetical protein